MKIQSFSHIGKRETNEDYLKYTNNCCILCDGMGGHVKGEIASKEITETVLSGTNSISKKLNKEEIQKLLQEAQQELNHKLTAHPDLNKMGTTFTGLFFSKEGFFATHIGDSRIYLIRPAEKKIWHTWDHSLVGELMKHKEIHRETGRHHPMGNRISRAIQANLKGKTVQADITKINAPKEGDLFLLCSDGVNEAWPEHELMALLCDTSLSMNEKLNTIKKRCSENSKDNATAILTEVESGGAKPEASDDDLQWLSLQDFLDDYQGYLKKIKKEQEEEEEDILNPEIIEQSPTDIMHDRANTHLNKSGTKKHKSIFQSIREYIGF